MASRGQIQIEVVSDTTRFAADLQRKLRAAMRGVRVDPVRVDGDTEPLIRRVREAQGEVDRSFRGLWDNLASKAEKAGANIGAALGIGLKLALATAVSPAVQSVVALLASIGPAAAAAIPAAIGVFATFKVALLGVGDAFKEVGSEQAKFDEATQGLSKNAKSFLVSIRSILPQLKALKNAVQDRFFAGLDKDVQAASKSLLGPLKSGMSQTATGLNGIVREVTKFAASSKGVALVNAVFDVTNKVIAQLTGRFGPLLDRLSDFVTKAANSGVNSAFIKAKDTLSSLGEAARNVTSAVGSIFTGLDKDGPAVAASLAQATKAVKDFLASPQAQELLKTLGQTMDRIREIALRILEVLPSLTPAVTGLAQGGFGVLLDVVQKLVDLLAPLAEKLGGQKELFTNVGAAIAIAVVAVKAYQAALVLVAAAQVAWNIATTAGNILLTTATVIINGTRLAAALLGVAFTAAGAQATILASALWAQVTAATAAVAGWVRMGAAAVVAGAQQAAALAVAAAGWVRIAIQSGLATVRLVAYTVAVNAIRVATIAWTAVQWLLNAAMTANPIGIVIAIIVALVAAIVIAYQKSDTFRAIVQGAFQAIGAAAMWLWNNALKPLWDGIVAGFEFVKAAASLWWQAVQAYFQLLAAAATKLWEWIKAAWNGIVAAFNFVVDGAARFVSMVVGFFTSLASAAAQRISSLVSFVTSIPGRILSAIGNLGSLLYNAGANIIQGLINGISSMIGRLTGAVSGAVQKIRDFLPFSPAKVGPLSGAGAPEKSGMKIMSGVATGIERGGSMVADAMNSVTSGLTIAPPGVNGNVRGGDGASAPGFDSSTGATGGGLRVWPNQPKTNPNTLVIQSDGTKYSELLVQEISKAVRVRGGDVQKVLGKTQGGVQ